MISLHLVPFLQEDGIGVNNIIKLRRKRNVL